MMRRLLLVAIAAVLAFPALAADPPAISNTAVPQAYWDGNGNKVLVDPTHPLPTTGGSSGGGSSGPANGTGGISGVTVGTASTQAVASTTGARKALLFRNESMSATVAICPASVATPALNLAGCYTLPPLNYVAWSTSYVPQDGFNAVASAANTPLTVEAH